MAKPFYIQDGVVSNTQKKGASSYTQLFDVKKWTTDLLTDYGLIDGDPCCASGATGITNAKYAVYDNISAQGTNTSGTTTVLNYGVNVIQTVTITDNSAKLPQPVTGKVCIVVNMSSLPLYLYPSNPGGKINNLPVDTPLVIPPDGVAYQFICTENPLPGNWSVLNNPSAGQIILSTISIAHVSGVADSYVGVSSTITTGGTSASIVAGNLSLTPAAATYWRSELFPAVATYAKIYTNILAADIPSDGVSDWIQIARRHAYKAGPTTANNYGSGIYYFGNTPGGNTPVISSNTGSLSSPPNIGDTGTFYEIGGNQVLTSDAIQLGTGGTLGSVYYTYTFYIPASAATKTYKFLIIQEYV
jgi:hypothetical protein